MLREIVLRGTWSQREPVLPVADLADAGQCQKAFAAMEVIGAHFFKSSNPVSASRQMVRSATSAAVLMLSAEILSMVSAPVCQ